MIQEDEILELLLETNLALEKLDIKPEVGFLSGGYLDSFGFVELIGKVEERFGISISEDELIDANIGSVSKMLSFVKLKLGK